MIIIAENKTNHYLMKNFLIEIKNAKNKSLTEGKPLDENDENLHSPLSQAEIDYYKSEKDSIGTDDTADTDPDQFALEVHQEGDIVKRPDLEDLHKLLINKPQKQKKVSKLIKIISYGLAIPLIAAATYLGTSTYNIKIPPKIIQQIADTNNFPLKKANDIIYAIENSEDSPKDEEDRPEISPPAIEELPLDNKSKQTNPIIKKQSLRDEIKKIERLTPYPYKDVDGISIGYGTKFLSNTSNIPKNWKKILYKRCNITSEQIEKFENENSKHILEKYENSFEPVIKIIKKKIEIKKIELQKWKGIKNPTRKIRYTNNVKKRIKNLERQLVIIAKQKRLAESRGVISKELAEICFENEMLKIENHVIPEQFGNDFDLLDEILQEVIKDMMYNVGTNFLNKTYTNFNRHIRNYIKLRKSPNQNTKLLIKAARNIYTEISDRSPDYLEQQAGSGRAKLNISKLKRFYENVKDNSISESYKIKNIYKYLFN